MSLNFSTENNGLRLSLHVQPGSARDEFAGMHGESIKLRIRERARDGAANRAVCEFLSDFFSVPKTSVKILRGESSRHKTVFIEGDPARLSLSLERLGIS